MNSLNTGSFEFSSDALQAAGVARLAYVRKVYSFFGLGLLTAASGTMITMGSPAMLNMVAMNPWITFFVMIGGIFFAKAMSNKPQMALPAMLLFTFISGASIAPMLYMIASGYIPGTGPGLIYNALIITCLIFAALTTYVFLSKKDFSMMGASLTIGLFLVIGASLVNMFVASSTMDLALSVIIVILFSGFILYDTSRILKNAHGTPPTMAALSLYLDFLNLFLALLRILGGRRD